MRSGKTLRVYSTFTSINGEVCQAHQGSLCTFIRLAGCNLRCSWCDTEYAQENDSGMEMSVDHLIKGVKGFENKNVTITGGEPFMQADPLFFLFKELMIEGYRISVETNGSISFAPLEHIDYVVDYKMPSSGEFERMNRYTPFLDLKPTDWIKFVIQTTDDYQMAIQEMRWLKSEGCDAQFAMSPILNTFPINSFLNRLQMGNVSDVVVSVQLHKLLKLDEAP